MEEYIHSVFYYETDAMGITHHSNYIRWMEEARIDYLKQIGYPYEYLVSLGIASPVVTVTCDYKEPTKFGDKVKISLEILEYTGIRIVFKYTFKNAETDKIVAIGTSSHCFLKDNKIMSVKREMPEFHNKIAELQNNYK